MGIGDWGLGIGDWAQYPIPNDLFIKIKKIKIRNRKLKFFILLKIMQNLYVINYF